METNNTNKPVNSPSIPAQSPILKHPVINQRGNLPIILAVLVLLLVVGSGAYYLGTQKSKQTTSTQDTPIPTNTASNTPTQTNEAELKTYTSTPLGFTIKYPSEWITNELTNSVSFRPPGDIANKDWGLVAVIVENKKDMTLDSYINERLCHSPGDCASAQNAESITISGLQGKKVVNPPAPVPSQIVVVIKGDKVYTLNVTLDKSFEEMYSISEKEQIFNEMLSSFTFTN